jgi:hypothetical protein
MLTSRLTKRRVSALIFAGIAFGWLFVPLIYQTNAADGANGNIQVSNQIFHVSGSVISVNMWNLDVSADHLLNWTGDDTGIPFTTSASQTTFTHTFVLTASTATVVFYLRAQSAGTIIDQVQVTVVNMNDFLSTGLIISAGIFVLIIVIFARVARRR